MSKKKDPDIHSSNVTKYILDVEKQLRSELQKLNAYTRAEIETILKKIHKDTRDEMTSKYKFNEEFTAHGVSDIDYTDYERETVDNSHWLMCVLHVPYYQTLGDTIGYKNGDWEFNYNNTNAPHEYVNELLYEFIALGGINDLSIKHWRASDDTILYMTTYRVLSEGFKDIDDFGRRLRLAYLDAYPMIENRDIGETTKRNLLIQRNIEWDQLPYSSTDIGAGGAMRSGCIGMFYLGEHNREQLIALAVECCRITHNSAIAIMGSIVAALFTAYALERIPVNLWPHELLRIFRAGLIDEYMKKSRPREYALFAREKHVFTGKWENYVSKRFDGISPKNQPFMKNPVMRYENLVDNFSKGCDFPGACGDDSVIMAYDALLISGNVVEKIIVYSILHPGDSDTVGSIALSWFGAFYHSPRINYLLRSKFKELEFLEEICKINSMNIEIMTKVYFYDIYLNIAKKYLEKY